MKKNIFYMILGGILFTTVTALAYNVTGNDIFYKKIDNQDKSAKQALDELYTKITEDLPSSQSTCPNGKLCVENGTPTNYIYDGANEPTTSSPTTPPTDKNVYLGLYADGQYGVCINRNGSQECFRNNNFLAEKAHMQQVFSDISCTATVGAYFSCSASDYHCSYQSDSNVSCTDISANIRCKIDKKNSVKCSSL